MEDKSAPEEEKDAVRVPNPKWSNKSLGPRATSYRQDVKVLTYINLKGERSPSTLCGMFSPLRKNNILETLLMLRETEREKGRTNTASDALLSESEEL